MPKRHQIGLGLETQSSGSPKLIGPSGSHFLLVQHIRNWISITYACPTSHKPIYFLFQVILVELKESLNLQTYNDFVYAVLRQLNYDWYNNYK
jgi:hypothetical protein